MSVMSSSAVLRRYLRRHRDVTGGASPIKTERHALLALSLLLHRAHHCRPLVNLPPRPSLVRLTFLAYSLGALETCAAILCSALHLPCRSRNPPWASPPAVVARPHRSCPRSNPILPRALGEHVVVPHRLPGRERGRLVGIRPAPPPPMPKAPIARPPVFLGCFLQTRGMVVTFPIFVGSPVQKGIFTSICKLLKLVKYVENHKKFKKNANSILLDSLWKILQLLLYSHSLILYCFNMKNRNVKNLDLP
jgi:hypothetical protein